jgi:hypothetical protein
MNNLTFVTSEWNEERSGRDNVIHKVVRITLRADNDHNIPSGFGLRAVCGEDGEEAALDWNPSHIFCPEIFTEDNVNNTLTKCKECFPEEAARAKLTDGK